MNATVRVVLGVIYVVITLLWCGSITPASTVLLAQTVTPRALVGFAGVETTPDQLISFRWSTTTAQITVTAPRTRFAVLSLYAASARADTHTTIAIQQTVVAAFHPVAGSFRHYHTLVATPYQPHTTLTLDITNIPATHVGNRTLGIALAALHFTPVMPRPWQLPPLTWLVIIGLSALSMAAVQWRWHLSRVTSLVVLASASLLPWLMIQFSPWDTTVSIGVFGFICALIVLIQIARDIYHTYHWHLPQYALPPALGRTLVAVILIIVAWGLIRVWPIYAQRGWWMQLIFVGLIMLGTALSWRPHIVRHPGAHRLMRWIIPVVGVAFIILYHFITLRQLNGAMLSDLPYHLDDARLYSTGQRLVRYMVWVDGQAQATTRFYAFNWNAPIPHPLLHASTGLIASMIRDRFFLTAFPITLLIYHCVSMVMLAVIVRRFAGPRVHWTWVGAGMLSIFASTALYFPDINPFLYKGQGGNIIVHNATTLVTRPVTWAALWVAAMALAPRHATRRTYWMILATLLAVLAALGKPNAPLAFVPAMVVVMLGTYIVHRSPAPQLWWWMLPIGCVVGVLAYQSTIRSNGGNDFAVDIWTVARMSSPHPILSMLQLTALPLTTLGVARWLWRDRFVQVCVVAFVVAVAQYWVFSEPADMQANNFAWGMRIMIPACYAIAVGSLLRMLHRARTRWTTSLLVALATAHVIAGVLYIWQVTMRDTYL
jgi:hypothetical protein